MGKDKISFEKTIKYNEEKATIQDYCTDRGFPLGGIGTGGFNILTDGGFGKFRTNHNWFRFVRSLNFPKGTFFAVRTEQSGIVTSRILRREYQGGNEYKNIRNIEHTTFKGLIPQFSLKFISKFLPIDISLSGFTSLIPHNVKDSSLPVAFFRMNLSNKSDKPVNASILFSFENILGLGGSGGSHLVLLRDGPVAYRRTRGNYQEIVDDGEYQGILLKTKQDYKPNNPRRRTVGKYLICSPKPSNSPDNPTISFCPGWNSRKKAPLLLDVFKDEGTLEALKTQRDGDSGAYCSQFKLRPHTDAHIDFYIAWWTPYYVIEKNQRVRKFIGIHDGTDYGHYYLNHFRNIQDLLGYCMANRDRLEEQSLELINLLEKSTLPQWLQTYILNSTDSMLINSLLTQDKGYYMIEGCPWDWIFGGLTGTIDQRLVSHPYSAIFFPDLDLNELACFRDLTENGRVPHGDGHCDVALGTTDVPYGQAIKVFNLTEDWTDLPQSFILQMGKMILQTGDLALLGKNWDIMTEMMDYLAGTLEDGIPEGITTYDYAYYTPHFIYSGTVHIATLKMMIELGNILLNSKETEDGNNNDRIKEKLEKYGYQLETCRESIVKRLWNEKGFFNTCSTKQTVFTSGLAGDWISRFCGLGPAVDYEKALSHSEWQHKTLVEAYKYTDKNGEISRPRVYREADTDGNEIPVVRGRGLIKINYANNPWQSIVFQGIEAIYLNKTDHGLRLIKRIWDKGYYEGYPWNMNNWGFSSHIYMSHPGMWSIFHGITGASINLCTETMILSPRHSEILSSEEYNLSLPVFFTAVWFWFEYIHERKSVIIEVIKTFVGDQKIETIIHEQADGTREIIKENVGLKLEKGRKILLDLPN